jgi:hypothetical protein
MLKEKRERIMPWQQEERDNWYKRQKIQRSYQNEVVSKIRKLNANFDVIQYGALSEDPERYPLFLLRSKKMDPAKKLVLITGGVHGYETSGVHGALGFLQKLKQVDEESFNFICAPCLSPWAYETINRWNTKAIDPNRSFHSDSPAEECRLFIEATFGLKPFVHFDLHETTDTDNTVFRPALEQRDGTVLEFSPIPDGFYAVGDTENPQAEFQKAIIDAVRRVTHIAPADERGTIIGDKIEQDGVINYPLKKLFLCAGLFTPKYCTTTEVYPDSPKVTPQICIEAQIAAIRGGLEFIKNHE